MVCSLLFLSHVFFSHWQVGLYRVPPVTGFPVVSPISPSISSAWARTSISWTAATGRAARDGIRRSHPFARRLVLARRWVAVEFGPSASRDDHTHFCVGPEGLPLLDPLLLHHVSAIPSCSPALAFAASQRFSASRPASKVDLLLVHPFFLLCACVLLCCVLILTLKWGCCIVCWLDTAILQVMVLLSAWARPMVQVLLLLVYLVVPTAVSQDCFPGVFCCCVLVLNVRPKY